MWLKTNFVPQEKVPSYFCFSPSHIILFYIHSYDTAKGPDAVITDLDNNPSTQPTAIIIRCPDVVFQNLLDIKIDCGTRCWLCRKRVL